MSGAGRKTIYKDMKTGAWPNGLTVDHFEKRIVWTDARFKKNDLFLLYLLLPFTDSIYKLKRCPNMHVLYIHTLKLVVIFICFPYDGGGDICLFLL